MALQVDAVVRQAQWVVDLKLIVLPLGVILVDVLALRVGDVGSKHLRLAVGQVFRREVMGDEAEGLKTGAVEKRAGAEGVKVGRGGIAELRGLVQGLAAALRTRLGNHDDLALVVDQAASGNGHQDGHQCHVEDQVGQLAAVAALRGESMHTGAVFFGGVLGHAPLLQALFDFCG